MRMFTMLVVVLTACGSNYGPDADLWVIDVRTAPPGLLKYDMVTDGFYNIKAVHSGLCLDATKQYILTQQACSRSSSQKFYISYIHDGFYDIATHIEGTSITSRYSNMEKGWGYLSTEIFYGINTQHFYFKHFGDKVYRIRSRSSGLVFDVEHGSKNSGAFVIQWEWMGQNNQRWRLEKTDWVSYERDKEDQ